MNTVRLEFSQFGHFESFDVFRHSEPMLVDSLPEPVATGLKTMFYVDSNVEDGDNYYRVRVNRDEGSLVSEEMYIRVTNEWSPSSLEGLHSLFFEDKVSVGSGVVTAWVESTGSGSWGVERWLDSPNANPTLQVDGVLTPLDAHFVSHDNLNLFSGKKHATICVVFKPSVPNTRSDVFGGLFVAQTALDQLKVGLCHGAFSDATKNKAALFHRSKTTGATTALSSVGDLSTTQFNIIIGNINLETGVGVLRHNSDHVSTSIPIPESGALEVESSRSLLISACTSNNNNSAASGTFKAVFFGAVPITLVNTLKIEGWVAHKYSLSASLPNNHPYKWVKPIISEDNKPYGLYHNATKVETTLRWGTAGIADSYNYYRAEVPFPTTNMPEPIKTGLVNTSYSDPDAINNTFYTRIGAVVNGVEALSDEYMFSVQS